MNYRHQHVKRRPTLKEEIVEILICGAVAGAIYGAIHFFKKK